MTASILVGIVTRNRANILPKAVSSALSQRGSQAQVQVAVIDDGSTDNTPELANTFPTVEWTRRASSDGYMAARNHWMSSTRSDYFVSLDDDAWFLQGDEIALAVDFLEREPSVAAVAFDILSPDRPNPVSRGTPQQTATFIGCGHMLRLSAVRAVGFYENTPGSYGGEEKDLCLRLLDAGHQVMLLPGVHVWHDKTPVAREFPAQYRSVVCNDLTMTLRRTPALLLPMALALKLYQHLTFAWKHQLARSCREGFRLFARSLPQVWRSRKPVRVETLRAFMRLSRS